jgi:hypothetical protein
MATAQELITVLSHRVRDPHNTAITVAQWLELLSRTQAIWNAATLRITTDAPITLEPYCVVYPIAALIPDAVRLITVRIGDHVLSPVDYSGLKQMNPQWLRDAAMRPEQWATLGRDLLIVHPAPLQALTLTVTYLKHTAPILDVTTELEMPEHEHPGLLDLTEAFASLKLRNLSELNAAAGRIKDRMGVQG